MPVTEILQSTVGRYHDLLGAALQQQLAEVVEADVLGELEVRVVCVCVCVLGGGGSIQRDVCVLLKGMCACVCTQRHIA